MSRILVQIYLNLFWARRVSWGALRRLFGLPRTPISGLSQQDSDRGAESIAFSRRPRVLIVHPYPVFPPYHGGGVRNVNLIRRLSRFCDLYLYVYSMVGDDPAQREALKAFCKKIYVHRRDPVPPSEPWDLMPRGAQFLRFQKVAEELKDIVLAEHIDLVQLEFAEMAQYVSELEGARVALTELDLSFVTSRRRRRIGFHRRFGTDRDLWSDRLAWLKLFRFEVRGAESVDQVHLMSHADGRVLAPLLPDGWERLRVLANGVDTDQFHPPVAPVREPRVLFLGSFGHTPNLDAVEYLLQEIWPLVRLRVPEAKLSLLGAHPPDWIRAKDGIDGIDVLGTVESTAEQFQRHRVFAAPIRVGSGTRLKILEAFSCGLPVVSTTIGAEGIRCDHDREMLIADEPGAFAEQLCSLLTDDALCERLGKRARQLAVDEYDWDRTVDDMLGSYRDLLPEPLDPIPAEPRRLEDKGETIDISVVIPTRCGGDRLIECLGAIRAQQVDGTVEVVCVDSGSSEAELAQMRRLGARVESIPGDSFNHGLTRDHGAGLASGSILVFLNQDAVPVDRLWLHRLTAPLSRPGTYAAIQGGIREAEGVDRFYWDSCGARFYFTSESSDWIAQHDGIGFSTVNAAIRRDLWERFPFGWAPIMEDKKWQRKVRVAGHKVGSLDVAAVHHSHNYNLRSLIRRCRSEGWGWKMLGERYGLRDAFRDMRRRSVLVDFLTGLKQGRIRTLAELTFPWVRPLALYWGNRWSRGVRLT